MPTLRNPRPAVLARRLAPDGAGTGAVFYFSRTGNTREVSAQVHELIGGDQKEIESIVPCPANNAMVLPRRDVLLDTHTAEQRSGRHPSTATMHAGDEEPWGN
jgi:hypothetical protein